MSGSKILLIEDNRKIAGAVRAMLQNIGHSSYVVSSVKVDVIDMVSVYLPDLIIIDVDLQGNLDGIETAKKILANFSLPIIFLSESSDTVIIERAKQIKPYGLLIKPFYNKDLYATIEIALNLFQIDSGGGKSKPKNAAISNGHNNGDKKTTLFVGKNKHKVRININDIMWVKALDNYIVLRTQDNEFIIRSTLKRFQSRLPIDCFLQVHRSYIVRLDSITEIQDNCVLVDDLVIPVGKSYKEVIDQNFTMV